MSTDDKELTDVKEVSTQLEQQQTPVVGVDIKDSILMPPPAWIPDHSTHTAATAVSQSTILSNAGSSELIHIDASLTEEQLTANEDKQQITKACGHVDEAPIAAPSKVKLNTPLATMLPPELADRDVTEWFPEFRSNQVNH